MSQSLQAVTDEFDAPISAEFSLAFEQMNLGLPPEVAMRELARRTGLLELKVFVLAMLIQTQTGGNLAEMLDKLASIMRERAKIKGKLNALTAEGRLQAIILLALPPGLFLILLAINRPYAEVLLGQPLLLVGIAVMELLGACGYAGSSTSIIDCCVPGSFTCSDSNLFICWPFVGEQPDFVSVAGVGSPTGSVGRALDKLTNKEDAASGAPTTAVGVPILHKIGAVFLPGNAEQRTQLQTRLTRRLLWPQCVGGLPGREVAFDGRTCGRRLPGRVERACLHVLRRGCGTILGIGGLIGPSLARPPQAGGKWRTASAAGRHGGFVICLEGGLSLPGAVLRVANELGTAHPDLAAELLIVQREVQMGRTTGDALRQFAERCDIEEIRNLAAVINQSERFGASLIKALRVHAETLRGKRLQYAEEMAHKAAIKILFPTLLCIFPGIFLIILGPAAIQLAETFSRFKN